MSYKTQLALGKNTTLQRQLEEKFVEFKRNLKSSRRRLDLLEEECLTALYKLIVDVKEKRDDGNQDNSTKAPDVRRAKSANPTLGRSQSCISGPLQKPETPEPAKRPMTSMSVRNYRQSYSFQKDGLNIDRSRRERYIKSKKQKEEKEIEIRRGNIHWAAKDTLEDRPKTASNIKTETFDTEEEGEKEINPVRPFTADPYQSRDSEKRLLQRSRLRNTLGPPGSALFRHMTSTPATEIHQPEQLSRQVTDENDNVGKEKTGQVVTTDSVVLESSEDTPTLVSMANDPHQGRVTPQITFRVTITKLNDMRSETPNNPEYAGTPRAQSTNDMNTTDDELIPLDENDKQQLETIMDDKSDGEQDFVDGTKSRLSKSPRSATKLGKRSKRSKTPSLEEDNGVIEMAAKTQGFLADYAKKSKLLGYVVKTRSSSAAPRDKNKKAYRSPNVTYQELVSIKANIKQQESRTRLLLQRSAKLAKYVETLANAGNVRKYLRSRSIKQ